MIEMTIIQYQQDFQKLVGHFKIQQDLCNVHGDHQRFSEQQQFPDENESCHRIVSDQHSDNWHICSLPCIQLDSISSHLPPHNRTSHNICHRSIHICLHICSACFYSLKQEFIFIIIWNYDFGISVEISQNFSHFLGF